MIYLLSTEFTKISETTGTIQNTSHITTIELSPSNVKGSGIFIYPLQSQPFNGENIYLRGVDGAAEARVLSAADIVTNNADTMKALLNAFFDISLDNSVLSFINYTGQVVKRFNLPEEIYLRGIGTTLVPNFTFNSVTYPNATNPNLNGKPVLVLHIKGDSLNDPYEDWGFVNLEDLITLYVPKDASIAVSNNSISAAISSASGNLLSLKNDGLFAGDDSVSSVADFSAVLQQSLGLSGGN